jgi:hypothetical protein
MFEKSTLEAMYSKYGNTRAHGGYPDKQKVAHWRESI